MKKRNAFVAAEEELLGLLKPHVPKKTYRDFEEILVIEFVSVTGSVLAGFILAQFLDKLALLPGILILLPGFLAMRGNIAGSLAARLGGALHLGVLQRREYRAFMRANTWAAFLLGIIVSVFLGLVAYAGTFLFFRLNTPDIIMVAFIAGIISNIILIPLTTGTTLWLYRKGYDPDNIMAPYITTIGDIVSVLSLIVAIMVV